MDINQAARMIEWLDEERRRDKNTIATLQERLAQQQEIMEGLTRRLNSVESDQTSLRGQVMPSGRDAELVEQMRHEMRQMIEGTESKRLTAEREVERRAELAREAAARPVRELTEKIGRLERQTTELPAMTVEKDRLSAVAATLQQRVDDLYKRLEEPDRRLAFLEEGRRTDSRRLSEMETELPEIRKQFDAVKPKITLLEDLSLRNERKVQDVVNGDRERRDQIQQFIDQQTLLLQQRDQQIQDLNKRFADHDETMKRNTERFEMWAETYREMKRIVDDFERIGERLERRVNEVGEMQRLSEDRFRQEWNDWRSDDQKRWKNFTLSTEEVWKNHDREFERFVVRLGDLEEQLPNLMDSLTRLWNLERERAQLYRERYQALLLAHDTPAAAASGVATVASVSSVNGVGPGSSSPTSTGTYQAVSARNSGL